MIETNLFSPMPLKRWSWSIIFNDEHWRTPRPGL